jgi:hypothetical protein
MINLLNDLLREADNLLSETFTIGRQCRYCTYSKMVGGERECAVRNGYPERCPEVERQLRVVLFHLDNVAHLEDPSKNEWLKLDF